MAMLHLFIFLLNISLHLMRKAKEFIKVELSLLFQYNVSCDMLTIDRIAVIWLPSVLESELSSCTPAKFIHKCRNFIHYHAAVLA